MIEYDSAPAEIVAFMDIGTNSIRLLVVRVEPNHSFTVLHQLKETVRLGEGEFGRHQLQAEAIDRAAAVVRQFASIARSAGATEIHAVATAATREAENQGAFLKRLRDDADVEVHVISGMEEARLVYLGVVHNLDIGTQQALCIDIGGGSTEVAVGTREEHRYLSSMKLGAIRLTSLFLANHTGAISDKRYAKMRAYIQNDAARTLHELSDFRLDLAVGSSGTIENLGDIAARMFFNRGWRREDTLSAEQLRAVITRLRALPLKDRVNVSGMNPSRADIIIGGAAILDVLMEELKIGELRISDRGVRDGMFVDYLLRHRHTALVHGVPVRERSVLQLGRKCHFNEPHARRTARFALELFDSAREAKLHTLGEEHRELLEYAALLHHIGALLSYSAYQKHTHYLVSNADLLGFDRSEQAMIAAICLYHRNTLPRKNDSALAPLSQADQQAVRTLAMILRLAENLDRGQTGCILDARFVPQGRSVDLVVDASQDCHVELSGLENQVEAFEKTFGRSLAVRSRRPAFAAS